MDRVSLTEREYLEMDSPSHLLAWLDGRLAGLARPPRTLNDRQHRLAYLSLLRATEPPSEGLDLYVESAERDLDAGFYGPSRPWNPPKRSGQQYRVPPAAALSALVFRLQGARSKLYCDVLRDCAGPVASASRASFEATHPTSYYLWEKFRNTPLYEYTHMAVRLSEEIIKTQDFTGMPVVADMIEDAGWPERDEWLLEHLRSPGPHFRCCRALDRLVYPKAEGRRP